MHFNKILSQNGNVTKFVEIFVEYLLESLFDIQLRFIHSFLTLLLFDGSNSNSYNSRQPMTGIEGFKYQASDG